jgi:VIT1/CCC1 family predicted Fe2+/Mn2+ transporter/rubrerythrin
VPGDDLTTRLLTAWRGEVEAGLMYELLARRQRDPKTAELLRELASVEGVHRTRLEARMRELGIAVPDPSTVTLSWWTKMQANVAPLDRLLAAREQAEDDEAGDLYARPTGDVETDALLADLRADEQSHSRTMSGLRAGTPPPSPAQYEAQSRLDRILGRETWHKGGRGWISGAIYGANDGLGAVFGIVAGVSGATGGSSFVLTAGLAGAFASALSMATGAFMAERSEAEMAQANIERERREIEEHPEEEREELSLFYQIKGIDKPVADEIATRMAQHPEAMLQALASEEFGSTDTEGSAAQAAVAAGLSTGAGAIVPVIPFFFVDGTVAIVAAAVVSLLGHFLVGAAKSLVTLRSWWSAGLEMTLAGVIVGVGTYCVGLVIPFHG